MDTANKKSPTLSRKALKNMARLTGLEPVTTAFGEREFYTVRKMSVGIKCVFQHVLRHSRAQGLSVRLIASCVQPPK